MTPPQPPAPRRRTTVAPPAPTSLVHRRRSEEEEDLAHFRQMQASRQPAPTSAWRTVALSFGAVLLVGAGIGAGLFLRPGGTGTMLRADPRPTAVPAALQAPPMNPSSAMVSAQAAGNDSTSCAFFKGRMDELVRLSQAGTIDATAVAAMTDSLASPTLVSASCAMKAALVNQIISDQVITRDLYQLGPQGQMIERSADELRRRATDRAVRGTNPSR